jgi:hypothetical protein
MREPAKTTADFRMDRSPRVSTHRAEREGVMGSAWPTDRPFCR